MREKSEEDAVIIEVEKLLYGHLFVGTYLDRRYVPEIQTYRDMVEVDETEKDFSGLLIKARSLLRTIGNTEVILHDLRLQVKLRGQPPLGRHWFKVRHVTKDLGHVTIKLKHIREAPLETSSNSKSSADISFEEQISEWGPVLTRLLRTATSPEGVLSGVRFFLLLIFTSGSALIYGVRCTAMFLQTALRDSSNLVRVSTPFLITLANIFMRISGWMLYFLMIVWKDIFHLFKRFVDPEGTPPNNVPQPGRLALPAAPGNNTPFQSTNWRPQSTPWQHQPNRWGHQAAHQRKYGGVQITEITD